MFCPVISLDGSIQVQQFDVIHLTTTPRAADLSGLVGIFDDFMEKSKITKCHKFEVDGTHPDSYPALDINQPAVGDGREADSHSYAISLGF